MWVNSSTGTHSGFVLAETNGDDGDVVIRRSTRIVVVDTEITLNIVGSVFLFSSFFFLEQYEYFEK